MFVKRHAVVFSALNLIVGLAAAQSIFDKAPKTAEKPEAAKPAAAAALATLTGAAPAAAPAATQAAQAPPKPAPLTIKDLAAKQADAMAADANKLMTTTATVTPTPAANPVQGHVVGELVPVSPIPVTMANPPKPLKPVPEKKAPPPPPPRPYFAALVGFKGKEVAEVHVGSQILSMKTGDSISEWKITGILDGRLLLTGKSSKKVNGKTVSVTKDRVLSVGDYL